MARLRKLGKAGHWFAYFYDPNRRPKEKSVALKTSRKDLAEKRLRELKRRWLDPADPFDPWVEGSEGPRGSSVQEAFAAFLASRAETCRPSSLETCRAVLEPFARLLPPGLLVGHIGAEHFATFLSDPGVSKSTRRMRYRHLKAAFTWLTKKGFIKRDPLAEIEPPREGERVPSFLTPSQLERLLAAMDAHREMRKSQPGKVPEVQWLKDLTLCAVCTA